jgi:hypothetical protein
MSRTLLSLIALVVLSVASPQVEAAPGEPALEAPSAQAAPSSRAQAARVALPGGGELVLGGLEGERASARVDHLDPRTGRWARLPDLKVARAGSAAVALYGGQVLITGGLDRRGRPLGSVEVYDIEAREATLIEGLQLPRSGHSATRLRDGRVLVVGGLRGERALAQAEIYDPVDARWYLARANHAERAHHQVAVMDDGRVRVMGGVDGRGVEVALDELFDPTWERWEALWPGQEAPPRGDQSDPYEGGEDEEPGC